MSNRSAAVSSVAMPMSTQAEVTLPLATYTSTVLTPLSVSIVTLSPWTKPLSHRYLAMHRRALPAIWPSEPSALNIRIRASAFWDFSISTMPSAPMPKWRSQKATHRDSGQVISPWKFSRKM